MNFKLFLLYSTITTYISNAQTKEVRLSYTHLDNIEGFRTRIFEADGEPVIAFGNSNDKDDRVYCLQFEKFYETFYDPTNPGEEPDDNEVSNSEFDFDDNTWNYNQWDNYTFEISTTDLNNRATLLQFIFSFEEVEEGSYGLKFLLNLNGYNWINSQAQFVLDMELRLCPDFNVDSSSDDNGDDDSTDDMKRRLESSSDSTEYALDIAVFKNVPIATKICEGISEDNVTVLMYKSNEDDDSVEIELIYDNFFGCDLKQDPYVFVDTSGFGSGLKWWHILLIILGALLVVVGILWIVRKQMKKRKLSSYENIDTPTNKGGEKYYGMDNTDDGNKTAI